MRLDEWADIATIVGAFVGIFAIFYTGYQIHRNTLISQGQFWLELEKMFSAHDEVHINLRPGGKWAKNNSGPESVKDWVQIEDYMGLFEHCEAMLSKNLIDWQTFGSIFSYRINNILKNKKIVIEKLNNEKELWQGFLRLLEKLEIQFPNY